MCASRVALLWVLTSQRWDSTLENSGRTPYLCIKPKTFCHERRNLLRCGLAGMIAITVLLICLFLAAWKAPKWVKEIGLGALVVGIFWSLRGLSQMLGVLQMIGDVSPAVICGGLKVTLISTSYGLIVYFISLIIRVIQKPRI